MSKVLFVGLDNPQSSDPRYALYPVPTGCAGHNLMEMMKLAAPELTLREYINIPKINLFPVGMQPKTNRRKVTRAAGGIIRLQAGGWDYLVLMGKEVTVAVVGEELPPLEWYRFAGVGVHYGHVPHPSGRNRWYNVRGRKKRAGKFIMEVVSRA